MKVQRFVLGMFATNTFIVYGNCPEKCILIDPADNGKELAEWMKKENLTPEAVLLSHGHYDHYLAVPDLQREWETLPVYCHPLDCPKETKEYDMGMVFPTVTAFNNVKHLSEGQVLHLAGFEVSVMHTPGHTPGSVTFFVEDAMFTGDFLFYGSIGRTDFKGGSMKMMGESLKRIATLSGDYDVYPGHDAITTFQRERKYNPYLKLL